MPKILKTKKVNTSKIKSNQKPALVYFLSALKGFGVTALVLLVVSLLVTKNSSFTMFTKVVVYISIGAGSFLSGFICQKKLRQKGVICGSLTSAFYLGLFIICTLTLMRFNVSPTLLLTVPIIAVSGIVGGIISANS